MHPAASIIVFTALSGLGYGLAAVLGLGLLDPAALPTRAAHGLALLLVSAGLLSSTLHLGNPQRAWRAFSQWRSSWLSREGVAAVLTFVPMTAAAWLSVVEGCYLPFPGLLTTAGCVVTVFCTAMIYASLKSVDAWHTPLTPACYLAFAAAGGATLAAIAGSLMPSPRLDIAAAAAALVAAAWIVKAFWWRRLRGLRPTSTPGSATGLGGIGRVRLFERPHTNENYLTREMGYRIARRHAVKLSRLALVVGGLLPAVLLVLAMAAGPGTIAALLAVLSLAGLMAGIAVERWLFFAEARHAVTSYYDG